MKKLFLAISLFTIGIQAVPISNPIADLELIDETTTSQSPTTIAFLAKFQSLYTMTAREYLALEKLFQTCASEYIAVYDEVENLQNSTDETIQLQAFQIGDLIAPLGKQLTGVLYGVKDVNELMDQFNATPVDESTFGTLTSLLTAALTKLLSLKQELESILELEKELKAQVILLNSANHYSQNQ